MKLIYIGYIMVIIIVGYFVFSNVWSELPEETKILLSFDSPLSFLLFAGAFLCSLAFVVFFWVFVNIQMPAVFGGESGLEKAKENEEKFISFFRKFIFWRKE